MRFNLIKFLLGLFVSYFKMGCTVAVVKKRTYPKFTESFKNGSDEKGVPAIEFSGTHSKLNMTDREIFLLEQSWKGISRQMEYTGINMFIR